MVGGEDPRIEDACGSKARRTPSVSRSGVRAGARRSPCERQSAGGRRSTTSVGRSSPGGKSGRPKPLSPGRMKRTMPRATLACASSPTAAAAAENGTTQSDASRDGRADTRATAAVAGSIAPSRAHTSPGASATSPNDWSARRCACTSGSLPASRASSSARRPRPSASARGPFTSSSAHAVRGAARSRPSHGASAAPLGIGTATVRSRSGAGRRRTLISVSTPSVPHAPVTSRVMSKPATFFTTRPPARTTWPAPSTSCTPMTLSRGVPNAWASGPADAVATVAPSVPRGSPNGSAASSCRSVAVARAIVSSGVPGRAVSVRSPGT